MIYTTFSNILARRSQLNKPISTSQSIVQGVPEAICSGGYPEPNTRTGSRAHQWYKQYLNAIIQRDVKDIAAIRDENELLRLMELLAYRTANLLNISSLSSDLGVDRATAEKYLTILERLFLFQPLKKYKISYHGA